MTKNLIILIMLILSMMMTFIENFFFKWMIMEFFSLLFIIYLNLTNKFKIISLFYFIISSITSLMLFTNLIPLNLYTNLYMNILNQIPNLNNILIQIIMMLKIGLFPFHFWMPNLFTMMSWNQIFLFMTINKFIPIYFLTKLTNLNSYIFLMLLINMMFPLFMTLNENCPKKIMGYISISHSSYFILFSYMNSLYFIFYLTIYSINLFILINFLKTYLKSNSFYNTKLSNKLIFMMFITVIIYNMIPPLMTFMMKWMFFCEFVMIHKSFFYLISMLISSTLSSWVMINNFKYFYMHKNLNKKNNFKLINNKLNYYFISYLMYNMLMFHMFYLFIY